MPDAPPSPTRRSGRRTSGDDASALAPSRRATRRGIARLREALVPAAPPVAPDPLLDPIAAHGLGARGATRRRAVPLDDAEWSRLSRKVARDRCAGLLLDAIEGGDLAATAPQVDDARRQAAHTAAAAGVLDAALGAIVGELDDAGVPTVVLKGAAHAHVLEDDPSRRGYGDIDLFVHPDAVDRAGAALVGLGAGRSYRQPRPGFDRRFWKGGVYELDGGIVVDLHCRLAVGALGFGVDAPTLLRSARPFQCGGTTVQCLGTDELALHTLLVPALSTVPAAHSLRDLALALRQPDLDAPRVLGLARAWGLEAAVARSWDEATGRLGVGHPEIDAWRAGFEPTSADLARLSVHTAEDHHHLRAVTSTFLALRSPRDRAAFVGALLLPDAQSGRSGIRRWAPRPRPTRGDG